MINLFHLKQPGFTYSACDPFKIASDRNYDGYQRGLASMVYTFFDKKSKEKGIVNEPNYQLANELQKRIIRKF